MSARRKAPQSSSCMRSSHTGNMEVSVRYVSRMYLQHWRTPGVKDMVSNCELKILLDQGGSDRNALSKILELSNAEFRELANPEPGQCLIVCGDQILQCDAYIEQKESAV